MPGDKIQLSPDAKKFAMEMEDARRIAKVPELFNRSWVSRGKTDEICILRRWNSHTPSVWDAWGGGYFIRWHDRGTIIDPGCAFVRLFRERTPYEIGEIHMVIATHDHVDHNQDFGTLITLFREYNKWLVKQSQPPRTWDLLMSYGVEDQINSLLVHKENAPFLRWNRILPFENIEQVQPPPAIAKDKSREQMSGWCEHLSAYTLFCQETIEQEFQYKLKLFPTKHMELLGGRTGFGLQFELIPDGKIIVISGDTGFDDALNLAKCYSEAHMLILHVGTMEDTKGNRISEHLGLDGVTRVLSRLGRRKLKLVVLTEWGYEFGRLPKPGESGGRSRFTKLVEEQLRRMGCESYFAAVTQDRVKGKIPIIPADVGLRISLPDLQVWSEDENNRKGGFIPFDRAWAEEKGDNITYRTIR